MPTTTIETRDNSTLSAADRITLAALFRHPVAHDLEWNDAVALFGHIGTVDERPDNEFAFEIGGQSYATRKPHSKDLSADDVMQLRHFVSRAGWSLDGAYQPPQQSNAAPALLIVIDHHEAKIFHLDLSSNDVSEDVIKPFDPHHVLHHLTHKNADRERGQRAPEEAGFYERIARILSTGGPIVLVSHAKGKSNAGQHLDEYLQAHYRETWKRVVHEIVADLSSVTTPQLLQLARKALR